jgi:RNA polymerase sigma-70 factor (ECF subfamily)
VFRQGRERDARGDVVPFDADRPAVEAARRDPRRFETLYHRYVAQIYSFALYETRDHHVAEDLTEQVFLQALRALPRFDERGDPGSSTFRVWLFQIARNAIANERRRERRHPVAPLELAWDVAAVDDPAAAVVRRDELERAWAAVLALPEERRRALVLRFVEEMSIHEIAQVMGRSEGAVRVLVHRALRSVAAALAVEARDGDLRPVAASDGGGSSPAPATARASEAACERRRWWRR